MLDELPENLRNLPAEDRLALIDLLWESLENAVVPVSDTQLAELRRRCDALADSGTALLAWADVQAELEQRLR